MKMNMRPTLVIRNVKTLEVYADRDDVAPVSTVRIRRESRLDLVRYAAAVLFAVGICTLASSIDNRRRRKK